MERVREIEEEMESAREMLQEIDYMEPPAREQWVSLAWGLYREVVELGTERMSA